MGTLRQDHRDDGVPFIPSGPITRAKARRLKDAMALFIATYFEHGHPMELGLSNGSSQGHELMLVEVQLADSR